MRATPESRYAKSGELSIAFQEVGAGPAVLPFDALEHYALAVYGHALGPRRHGALLHALGRREDELAGGLDRPVEQRRG